MTMYLTKQKLLQTLHVLLSIEIAKNFLKDFLQGHQHFSNGSFRRIQGLHHVDRNSGNTTIRQLQQVLESLQISILNFVFRRTSCLLSIAGLPKRQ